VAINSYYTTAFLSQTGATGRNLFGYLTTYAQGAGTLNVNAFSPGDATETLLGALTLSSPAPPAVLAAVPGVCELDCSGDDATPVSLSSRRSASSGEIFPAASNSRTLFVSADISFSFSLSLANFNRAAPKPRRRSAHRVRVARGRKHLAWARRNSCRARQRWRSGGFSPSGS